MKRGKSNHLPRLTKEEMAKRAERRARKGRNSVAERERKESERLENAAMNAAIRQLNSVMPEPKVITNNKRVVGVDYG